MKNSILLSKTPASSAIAGKSLPSAKTPALGSHSTTPSIGYGASLPTAPQQ